MGRLKPGKNIFSVEKITSNHFITISQLHQVTLMRLLVRREEDEMIIYYLWDKSMNAFSYTYIMTSEI